MPQVCRASKRASHGFVCFSWVSAALLLSDSRNPPSFPLGTCCRASRTTALVATRTVYPIVPLSLYTPHSERHILTHGFPNSRHNLKQTNHPEGNLDVLRWCASSRCPCHSTVALPQTPVTVDRRSLDHTAAADGLLIRVNGRLAESMDPVLFIRFDEVEKCEFIKMNAPEEAWASTDDGAGLLIKASALCEQAREALVSAARSRTSPQLVITGLS